ncbi:immunity 7 family protein [Solirubrobacter taibaiensis]|nr:immunity 7 family protein [Solirubrobacter taibaiensis]
MFEYHGWATILDSTGYEDLDEDPSTATLDAVRRAMADSGLEHRVALDARNGSWFLRIHGLNNHRNPDVAGLFEAVARIAPGSSGVLFTHDEEAGLGPPRGPDEPTSKVTFSTKGSVRRVGRHRAPPSRPRAARH